MRNLTRHSNLLRYCLFFCGLLFSISLSAQERILSFHSDITIAADASMTVTETIRVRAEGSNIRRGIYREFPTRYTDRFGNNYRVDFQVQDVTRNGEPEIWTANERANGVRVDFGGEDLLAVPAVYEYTIRYRSNRQIGFFQTHDELYWNVTGNGWSFVIEQTSATVTLPQQVSADNLSMEAYTGLSGEQGQNYAAAVGVSRGSVRTTAPLSPGAGLTLVFSWPKGIIAELDGWQKFQYLLYDNRGLLLALLTLLLSAVYLFSSWLRVGRDPEPGVIFPLYEPPAGYSPASLRYVRRMSYDNTALTSAIVNLAVKGYVRIRQFGEQYTLEKTDSTQALAAGEKALLDKLFGGARSAARSADRSGVESVVEAGATIKLEQKNHSELSVAITAHKKALKADYRDKYFVTNGRYLLPAVLASALMFLIVALIGGLTPLAIAVLLINIPLLGLFAWLLHAPTAAGRKLLDKIEGFRMYLDVAEKDDLQLRHPPELTPELTPELFERYLPYAIALDVEKAWANRFTRVFAEMETRQGKSWQPLWYYGSFNAAQAGDFTNAVSRSFTSAISSASRAPGSASGSGGGGSSGGGGGGGGGGGR